ncbi:alpha/beta fold hydrolase [Bradyrhizobium sp. 200]|uniref:alpha/beta fold hydrolase n=1 Tax=Bradyrhizobium sp. 200 TaxID=2782665 RepID=UPI0020004CAD|nr:alpha/beta fold hydrolase [Bradyrhizobium sp. 200]UPJ50513.1 alpha/beta fold hydrolase [Bradyrhizobium sp. 200]
MRALGGSIPAVQVIRSIRDANGARIAYAMVGEGPLILCPAWWVSHVERDWEHPGFRRFFGRLAEGFRAVRYDRPGTGLSDRDVPPRTQADEVQLLATLADELGDSQFSLFAVSCAGPVALAYAAAHQERVRRLCLYGSYARGSDIATPDLRDALTDLVKAHWGLGSVALTALFLPGASSQDSEDFSRNQRDWANAPQAAQLLRLSCQMNAADVLSRVRAEALVIHRRKDRAIPLEAGQKLAAELPRARLITMEGDVHLPWVDGDAIADTVHSFLAGDEVRAATSSPLSGCRLDEANREIVLEGQRRPTTRLEYAVMLTLIQASGRVVTRDELLAEIWNTPVAGSNKVDAVVGSLRKKLGPFATSIETVTGHGYRFRGWKKAVSDVH